jgi:hypothetical protein
MKRVFEFFDKLEFKVRGKLSHRPIIYGLFGSVGVIVFWRGVWHTADFVMEYFFSSHVESSTINIGALPWWDGPLSVLFGATILLATGLFVSSFIGNEIIISGLKGEKKLTDKTEDEVKKETGAIGEIQTEVSEITHQLTEIEKDLEIKK